mmetsp:Transcript_5019/g.9608  ORF Transcript_5019/g.9608 Transcript_5019/m.9608 type:complete len:216 (+) Transcript_5019:3382-4029(+)
MFWKTWSATSLCVLEADRVCSKTPMMASRSPSNSNMGFFVSGWFARFLQSVKAFSLARTLFVSLSPALTTAMRVLRSFPSLYRKRPFLHSGVMAMLERTARDVSRGVLWSASMGEETTWVRPSTMQPFAEFISETRVSAGKDTFWRHRQTLLQSGVPGDLRQTVLIAVRRALFVDIMDFTWLSRLILKQQSAAGAAVSPPSISIFTTASRMPGSS